MVIQMAEETLLTGLGLDSYDRLNANYGLFDTMALCASYDFSYEEFCRNKPRQYPDQPLTELLKTTLHETTHLYQMLSTPYGMYYYTLKQLQTDLVRYIMWLLPGKYGVEIELPLADLCEGLKPNQKYEEIRQLLYAWAMAELMVLYLEGNVDQYGRLLQESSLLVTRPMNEYFELLEFYVATFLNSSGRPSQFTDSGLDKSESTLLSELQYFSFKVTGIPDARGIMETWGKVSEYWGDQHQPLADCSRLFPNVIRPELMDYYVFLHWARDSLGAETVGEFILSYMAMCEIALFPPLLPHYRALRRDSMNFRQMNPMQRMLDILTVVRGVAPIQELEKDYLRFTGEVCEKLRWPTPTEIAKETVQSFRFPQGDRLSECYYQAQLFRCRIPHIFLDLGVWFAPERSYTREFYYYFSHPVIIFTDQVLYHPDRNLVVFFTMQCLMNNYLRRLLIAKDQSVTFPYRASQVELETYSDLMQSSLEMLCGIRPSVHMVNNL